MLTQWHWSSGRTDLAFKTSALIGDVLSAGIAISAPLASSVKADDEASCWRWGHFAWKTHLCMHCM